MTTPSKPVAKILEQVDVPASAYRKSKERYDDLGQWLHDPTKSESAHYAPKVYPQGSFRLGTVVRPPDGHDYDLDLSCVMEHGISRRTHSQEQLKQLIGRDLERYRLERRIRDPLEEKRRCWRLKYQDELGFHLDVVPALPEDAAARRTLEQRILGFWKTDEPLAQQVAALAVSLTDRKSPTYRAVTDEWPIGNQEGFARWFEMRMRTGDRALKERVRQEGVRSIEDLPAYLWRSPLQRCIQLLKRHRDVHFRKQPDSKPISVIITTLAAHAYAGEHTVEEAIDTIVHGMGRHVRQTPPRVPNPVNPDEDFADKWATTDGVRLRLEQNLWLWLAQAEVDFDQLLSGNVDAYWIKQRFDVDVEEPKKVPLVSVISSTAKPWYGA